ncbi:MAG TPA: transposase [Polyangiaceae bacterium]
MPSIDTLYRDLRRFDKERPVELASLMFEHGAVGLHRAPKGVHMDFDTTVEPLFGRQEGALPGPNPRFRGRPRYHPRLACIAETGTCIGCQLRPGDRGFGERDIDTIIRWLKQLRERLGPNVVLATRIDSAADCAALLAALDSDDFRFVLMLKASEDLTGARWCTPRGNHQP